MINLDKWRKREQKKKKKLTREFDSVEGVCGEERKEWVKKIMGGLIGMEGIKEKIE